MNAPGRVRVAAVVVGACIAASALLIFLSRERIGLYLISRSYGLEVSYAKLAKGPSGEYILSGFRALYRKADMGISSREARVTPAWRFAYPVRFHADFKLRDVKLLAGMRGSGGGIASLISIPFEERWTYDEVSGRIETGDDAIYIKYLSARGDEISFSFSGILRAKKTLDADLVIYFSKDAATAVPEAFQETVLSNEGEGRKSLSVHLAGDLKAPSVTLSGKMFRLNVKTVTNGKM